SPRLAALGCTVIDVPMDNVGTNPFNDLVLVGRFLRLLSRTRPQAMLNYTIKPVIYGGLASRLLDIPYVTTITGLGIVFARTTWLTRLVRQMYRVSQAS